MEVEPRDSSIKLSTIRKAGKMPAVFYGKKQVSTSVTVSAVEFSKVFKKAGESTVVILKSKQGIHESLIHAVDRDPISGMPRHADFYVFEKGQKIKVKVPIEFEGISPAVKELGGVLVKVLREIEIEASPKDLPRELRADISKLVNFQSVILAKDITIPPSVTLVTHQEEVVASVYEPKEEVVEEAPVDLSAIEVEKKGKEAKEGEEVISAENEAGANAPKTSPKVAAAAPAGKK